MFPNFYFFILQIKFSVDTLRRQSEGTFFSESKKERKLSKEQSETNLLQPQKEKLKQETLTPRSRIKKELPTSPPMVFESQRVKEKLEKDYLRLKVELLNKVKPVEPLPSPSSKRLSIKIKNNVKKNSILQLFSKKRFVDSNFSPEVIEKLKEIGIEVDGENNFFIPNEDFNSSYNDEDFFSSNSFEVILQFYNFIFLIFFTFFSVSFFFF